MDREMLQRGTGTWFTPLPRADSKGGVVIGSHRGLAPALHLGVENSLMLSGAKVQYPYAAFLRSKNYFARNHQKGCWQLKSHKYFQLVNVRT